MFFTFFHPSPTLATVKTCSSWFIFPGTHRMRRSYADLLQLRTPTLILLPRQVLQWPQPTYAHCRLPWKDGPLSRGSALDETFGSVVWFFCWLFACLVKNNQWELVGYNRWNFITWLKKSWKKQWSRSLILNSIESDILQGGTAPAVPRWFANRPNYSYV